MINVQVICQISMLHTYLRFDLKAHRQTSKKRCFEKYCSFDKACQVSALQGTP